MIEQKFQAFKQSVKPAEFNSIKFLVAKAEQIESDDPLLAKRILVRVNNLRKQKENVSKDNKMPSTKTNASNENLEKKKEKSPTSGIEPIVSEKGKLKSATTNDKCNEQVSSPFYSSLLAIFTKSPFIVLVVIPTFIFAFYQCFWATERYESQAQVIVQQPDAMATMDASMAILSGLGVSTSGGSDTELVKAYVNSNDMLDYLNRELNLREHFSQSSTDFFSRVHSNDSKEDFLQFYQKHITVEINSASGVVTILSQAFDAEFANQLTNKIVQRAEWYINSIGHQLAKAQLTFIKGEHLLVEGKLQEAQANLLNFQQQYNLLDPMAEGLAMQQITYTLEGQISVKETELKGLKSVMSTKAPQVRIIENELAALRLQLKNERNKLAKESGNIASVSEILAKFTDLKVKMELALQAYTSSQVSLEKSRIEAYRQLKYLITVEAATSPESSKYPDVFYNVALFAILSSIVFGIGRIITSTIKELK